MNRIYLIIMFLGVYSTVFSQKMENLYKFVIEDSYERMCTSGIINKNDTLYYFCKNCNNKNEYVYDYQINILNQHIRLKMPEVNEHKKHESGFMLLTPEIENQFIVISFIEYGVNYNGNKDINLVNGGTISYYFSYSKEKKKYVFVKRKNYSI